MAKTSMTLQQATCDRFRTYQRFLCEGAPEAKKVNMQRPAYTADEIIVAIVTFIEREGFSEDIVDLIEAKA